MKVKPYPIRTIDSQLPHAESTQYFMKLITVTNNNYSLHLDFFVSYWFWHLWTLHKFEHFMVMLG